MRKMYERRSAGGMFFAATFTQPSSYASSQQRQQVPVDRPPYCNTNSWEEYNADESDDSEADFDFSAAEEREFLRAEQQKRQAAARQQVTNLPKVHTSGRCRDGRCREGVKLQIHGRGLHVCKALCMACWQYLIAG